MPYLYLFHLSQEKPQLNKKKYVKKRGNMQ